MGNLDAQLTDAFLTEGCDYLTAIEADLHSIGKSGPQTDRSLIKRAYRSIHRIKGGADFINLDKVRDLARCTEDAVALVQALDMPLTPDIVGLLLRATHRLQEMLASPAASAQFDNTDIVMALTALGPDPNELERKSSAEWMAPNVCCERGFRVLLAEDDFVSRLLLQTFLSRYGDCHIAANGKEAVEGFRLALERGQGYDLICMDIMMPQMNGREAMRQVRLLEEDRGTVAGYGVKIFMTTAVRDLREVIQCYGELCDAYLVKPIDLSVLLTKMKSYDLVH